MRHGIVEGGEQGNVTITGGNAWNYFCVEEGGLCLVATRQGEGARAWIITRKGGVNPGPLHLKIEPVI